jgi:hypothetical protein
MVAQLEMPSRAGGQKFRTIDPIGYERRIFERKDVQMRVEARRLDHSLQALRRQQVSFSLRDLSLGGCSATTDIPMEYGEKVTLFFPPTGPNRGWDAYGRVVRCDPSSLGYRVAVEFDPLPAA